MFNRQFKYYNDRLFDCWLWHVWQSPTQSEVFPFYFKYYIYRNSGIQQQWKIPTNQRRFFFFVTRPLLFNLWWRQTSCGYTIEEEFRGKGWGRGTKWIDFWSWFFYLVVSIVFQFDGWNGWFPMDVSGCLTTYKSIKKKRFRIIINRI